MFIYYYPAILRKLYSCEQSSGRFDADTHNNNISVKSIAVFKYHRLGPDRTFKPRDIRTEPEVHTVTLVQTLEVRADLRAERRFERNASRCDDSDGTLTFDQAAGYLHSNKTRADDYST